MSNFDSNGNYNKTEWKDDDLITADKLNKIEDAIQTVNKNDIERHKEADGRLDELEQNKKVIEEELNNKATKDEVHERLDYIVRENIEIDVTNPPKNTNLLPLTNDASENTIRLQAIFDYIKNKEHGYQSDGQQWTGYNYKIKFPSGIIELSNTVNIKGSYIIIEGNRTIIRCNNGYAFNVTDTNFRKAFVNNFTFDRCNAFYINKNNVDCGLVTIDNCWFYNSPGEALTLLDQSAHYTFNKCHFYHCKYIVNILNVDHTTFRDCWFSELPREENGEASIILKGAYANFVNCFFIPSGYDRNDITTNENNLTDLAWINAYNNVVIDGCRVSSEPNNKTLINCRVGACLHSPYEPYTIEVKNCYRLCCTNGKGIINLFSIPNKINIINNSFGIHDNTPITYSREYDVHSDPAITSSIDENIVKIKVEHNIGLSNRVGLVPSELKKFIKIDEVQMGLIYADKTIRSDKKGVSNNQSIKIETNYTYNTSLICDSIYMIKMIWQPDSTAANYRSVFYGSLSFVCKKSKDGDIVEAILNPLISNQGGNYTSQENEIDINVKFGKTALTYFTPTSGDLDKINIYLSVNSAIFNEFMYTIREVTDGLFL